MGSEAMSAGAEQPRRDKCASCDEEGWDAGRYDGEGCLDGIVYGYCGVPECGGLCDSYGRCECICHDGEKAHA